ncbi:Carboxylesterase family [Popillia japonica]|uniref:Carboxylesterase family n=1 Tax=Popillia japonica TaxID=7064 RepID=A0AAW1HF70_POPJA
MALYCVPSRLTRSYILISAFCLFCVRSDQSAGTGADQPRTQPLTSRTVRTKYGDVSGVIVTLDSKHLEPVEVFRGIPYASPPLGSLRFMPPVTGALWPGVKIADKFSPVCPQRLPDIFNETAALKRMPKGRLEYLKRLLPYLRNQSEDCLYLNIYAPAQGRSVGAHFRNGVLEFLDDIVCSGMLRTNL